MRLELRQVEIRARAARDLLGCVVEEGQAEVEERRADRLAGHGDVRLLQVPAARPDHERGDVRLERVRLLIGLQGEPAPDRLANRPLPGDHVVPGGGQGVLEVAHEDARAGVERVDHHLRLCGAGDLDPPVVQIRGRGGDAPGLVLPDRCGLGQEVRELAAVEPSLALRPSLQQLQAPRVERAMQLRDERQRIRRQNLARTRRLASQADARHSIGSNAPVRRS